MKLSAMNSERKIVLIAKPINLLKPNDIYIYIYIYVIYIYMSLRSANLQTLHFKYLFNKYTH